MSTFLEPRLLHNNTTETSSIMKNPLNIFFFMYGQQQQQQIYVFHSELKRKNEGRKQG